MSNAGNAPADGSRSVQHPPAKVASSCAQGYASSLLASTSGTSTGGGWLADAAWGGGAAVLAAAASRFFSSPLRLAALCWLAVEAVFYLYCKFRYAACTHCLAWL